MTLFNAIIEVLVYNLQSDLPWCLTWNNAGFIRQVPVDVRCISKYLVGTTVEEYKLALFYAAESIRSTLKGLCEIKLLNYVHGKDISNFIDVKITSNYHI